MMKKRSLSMRLDSRSSTADSETHKLDTKDDSAEPLMLPCYICGKVYHSGKARILHVKMCARINNVSTSDLLALIKKSNSLTDKEEKELQSNRQLLAECDDLFTKQTHNKGGSGTKKKKVAYFDPVSAMEEEELQVALAISASLIEQEISCHEVVESSCVEKGDSSESLLLPSASASAELVECRTEALLCTKASHVDTDCDRSSLQPTCNNELFLNQPDIADSTDPIAMNYDYNNKDRITNKGGICGDHQSNDMVTQKLTLWNVAGYAEDEPSKTFYVLPLLQTNLDVVTQMSSFGAKEKTSSTKMLKGKSGVKQKAKPNLKAATVMKRSSQALLSKSIAESKGKLHALHAFSRGPRRKDDDGGMDEEYDDAWVQPKVVMKPEDQLQLTEQELKEEFTRILTAENPHAPKNLVRYNFKEKTFKQTTTIEQLAIHFALDGNLLHKESDEAQRQIIMQSGETEEANEEEEEGANEEQEEDKGDNGAAEEDVSKPSKAAGGKEQRLVNQFNFSERASQTQNNPFRERGTMTEPPPRANFSATANQMEIFDAYVEDIAAQEKAKEKKSTKSGAGKEEGKQKKVNAMDLQYDDISRVYKAAKIMERMVNQNTFDDIAQDFRYWDDASDEYKDGKGSLLPLWRFTYNKSKRMAVTALCWNPLYKDLFAVAHGSYDFGSESKGMICFHSLKNPTYPEYVYSTDAGVMSIDIHPEHPFLVVVGLYDGSVSVYNLQLKNPNPIYRSTANAGKHTDPVWQVAWQKNDSDNNLNFYSTSSDGRIVCWTIVKNELQYQDMTVLKVSGEVVTGPEGIQTTAVASGTAFDFNKMQDHLYIVGTEDGKVYKCSKAYSAHYLDVYEAHHLAVYALKWNPFHQNIFASCSADWTVKIWDDTQKEPMFSYDLNCPVGDVVWSPYASTVFAAVTTDGKVHVFDLSVNKYEPLAVQSATQKKNAKLTHIEFNPVYPIVIVGDDRGAVASFKLSPNLRKALKEKNYSKESEVSKMERLLGFVKEPLIEREIKMKDQKQKQ